MGTRTVEAYPAVLPGLLLIGRVADELTGPGKEQISRHDLKGLAAHFKGALARDHQMDQVVIPDTGAPGLARSTPLQAAVKDGQFDVVGVILLEGLFVNVCHVALLPSAAFVTPVYHN